MVQQLTSLLLTLLLLSSSTFAQTPILIYGTGRGTAESKEIAALLQERAPEGMAFEIEEKSSGELSPTEFGSYGCVIIAGTRQEARRWSNEEYAHLLAWLKEGGRLCFFTGGSLTLLGDTGESPRMEPLLGARALTKGKTSIWFDARWQAPDGAAESWMEGGAALTGLTAAKPIAGWDSGKGGHTGFVTLYEPGKGSVLYIGISSRALSKEGMPHSLMNLLFEWVAKGDPATRKVSQSEWNTTPLGAPVPKTMPSPPSDKRELRSLRKSILLPGEPLEIAGTTLKSAIILPSNPTPSEKLAAEEMADAFSRITTVSVPILSEENISLSRHDDGFLIRDFGGTHYDRAVLLGALRASREHGLINADGLPEEGYRYRTEGNCLLIAGRDTGKPGQRLMGTYHGVLAFLEDVAGVRWLWPGPGGEVYPPQNPLRVARVEASDAPALGQRRLRNGGAVALSSMAPEEVRFKDRRALRALFDEHKGSSSARRIALALSFLDEPMDDYLRQFADSGNWFRHQRTGGSFRLQYTHAYDDWHQRYGQSHPEWFALQPDGSRTPGSPERIRLCKANRELTDAIAADVLHKAALNPGVDSVSISPNDGGADNFFCLCPQCRALDPANGDSVEFQVKRDGKKFVFRYPSLSDRVVDFYNRIATKTAESHPSLKLGAYAYSFYRTPPLTKKLHPNVVIGFVGLTYFDDSRLERDRESWNGWAGAAESLFLRPNALHLGHGYPGVFVHRLARDLKHCYRTGMMGADFDSIVHHWATQGINYYVLAKLLWDPTRDVDALVDDYCRSAFGPAAEHVKVYFTELEKLTDEAASKVGHEMESALREEEIVERRKNPLDAFLKLAPEVYTPARLAALNALLDNAENAAENDEASLQRLRFLRVGLVYADFQSRLYRLVLENKVPSPESAALFVERQQFFKETFQNNFYAIGLVHIARRETALYEMHKNFLK